LSSTAAVVAAAPERGVDVVFLIHDDAQVALLPAGARTLKIHAPTALRVPRQVARRRAVAVVDRVMEGQDEPEPAPCRADRLHGRELPQRLTLDAADIVATVSETSAAEFARVHLTKRPVVVVPNAPQRLAELLPAGTEVVPGADM
jgi:hypothetical protein